MMSVRACALFLVSTVVLAQSSFESFIKNQSAKIVPPSSSQSPSFRGAAHQTTALPASGLNFALAVAYDSGGNDATSVAVADVNGDGKPDAVVANGSSNTVAVLLGNGDGTFQTAVTYGSGGLGLDSVAVTDVNGDGKPDLVVADNGSNTVAVLLGNGDGTFQTAVAYGSGGLQPNSVAIADLNLDGKPDLVVANCGNTAGCGFSQGVVGVLLGNGDGTFQTAVTYGATGASAWSVAVGDVNGDGKPDLLVAYNQNEMCSTVDSVVGVLLGNGDGTFQNVLTYDAGLRCGKSVALADVNGDGKPDALVAGSTSVGVLLGNGDGTFQTVVAYGSGGSAKSVAVADVNGDGKPDLVVANSGSNTVAVLLGNGDGTFQTAVTYGSGGLEANSVAVADVNSDSKPDLVVANCATGSGTCGGGGDGSVGVLINTSLTATATALTSSPNPSSFGQAVTFTATVTAQPGFSTGTPTGTVSFYDGTTNIGNPSLNSSGVATLMTSTLAEGTRSITAVYNGDVNFASSMSLVLSQVVQGAIAQLSSTSVNFGNQTVGANSTPQVTMLTNTGNVALTITSISVTGSNSGDFAETNGCGTSVAAGGSCNINVTFTPSAAGTRNAVVNIADNTPGSPQTIALAGVGLQGTVMLSPPSVSFPAQYVGTSGLPVTLTVTNTGTANLTITSVATSPADFGTLSNCINSVAPNANCTIGVFFDPTASGTRTGSLTITDNASGSPQTVTLSGAGQDFAMASSGSPTATVSPGQTANYTLAVTPAGGFKQMVSFTCSGAPVQSTCSVPSSVMLNGSTPTTVNVTVTTAVTSSLTPPADFPAAVRGLGIWLWGLPGLVILGAPGSWRKRRRGLLHGLAFLCLFLVGTTWSACGGGNSGGGGGSGTAGTYNLTVTGTYASGSTTLTHATKLTLVVQ